MGRPQKPIAFYNVTLSNETGDGGVGIVGGFDFRHSNFCFSIWAGYNLVFVLDFYDFWGREVL